MPHVNNCGLFDQILEAQEIEREGWMKPPETVEVTTIKELNNKFSPVIVPPAPSGMSVLDKLCASLQSGDVALVLTRPDLGRLTSMVEKSWKTDDEFRILGKLIKLRDSRHP